MTDDQVGGVASLDVLRSEALADADDTVKVPLGPDAVMISVLPSRLWRSSAMTALNQGSWDAWAEKCLTEDSYDAWCDIDPTNEEVMDFLAEYRGIDGVSPLSSRASRRSSRHTARR